MPDLTRMRPDLPPDYSGVMASIEIHAGAVGRLADEIRRDRAARNRPLPQPVFGRTAVSGVFPTSGPLILRFPLAGPDQGHFWYVRQLVVGGATFATAAAGRLDIFVSASDLRAQSGLAALGLADERDQAGALPYLANYSRGQIPLRFNEELYVVVSGGTVGQAYNAAFQFEDYEEGAIREDWAL